MDYRYAEAVLLQKIDAEIVAEALMNIYSRLGVSEEVLGNKGMQFMSDCMREVCCILSIKQKVPISSHQCAVVWYRNLIPPSKHVFKVCVVSNPSSGISTLTLRRCPRVK
ncbi:reverse transcriptase [Plakobranchus ocellatus]|uniref:Reverse transcriptase n=1 Tax=Plakobranchus ocellatus TaxID=259542 RepID=A0AAV4DT11_9GAST|nr:reverse transcriptase [Plakobranchus ocellatus]